MPTLYSGPLSLFTAKVRIALAEKGIAYERIDVGWSRDHRYLPHHPDVVAINPKRQVPCLVDGALRLYDSTLILEYLDERHPEPPLLPRDPAARARCRLLELEADEVLFPHVWNLIESRFYAGGDAERGAAGAAGVRAYQERLAASLGAGDHLCGDFSIADIGNVVMLGTAAILGAPVPDALPALHRWLDRMLARPSVATEMAAMAAVAFAG